MSDRKDFYVGELVTDADLNAAFGQLETADRAFTADIGMYGITAGLGVSQHAGTPDLTVDVTLGTAYATAGERMRVGVNTRVDCSVDRDGVSTTVSSNVTSRIVSIILRPERVLSDPRQDANSTTVYFQRTESYAMEVIQGAQAGVPSPPSIPAGSILICDITRTYGQTQILNSNIQAGSQIAHRRQDMYVLTGSPFNVRQGTSRDAMQSIVTRYNNHVNGLADGHDADAIVYGGSGFWADGSTTIPAGPVGDAISAIPEQLGSTTSLSSGSRKIGMEAHVAGGVTISAGTLYSWLVALRTANNIVYSGSGTWADSSSGLPSGTVEATFDSLVSTLAATTAAAKLGMASVGNFSNGTIQGGFAALTSTTTNSDGSRLVGVQAQSGQWSAGSLLSVLQWLGTAQAKTWSAQQTFGGGQWPLFDSRTVDVGHALHTPTAYSDAAHVSLTTSDLSGTPNGFTRFAPNIYCATSTDNTHWHLQPLDRLLNGNVLSAVKITSKISVAADAGMNKPTYDVVRWKVTNADGLVMESLLSGGATVDNHLVGTDSNTPKLQTITCDQNNTIDTSVWSYGIMIRHPWGAISGDARLRIYSLFLSYTYTSGKAS